MTYCVALRVEEGLVLCADTRTNAGVDNISVFSKLHVIEKPGERMIAIMCAGNLAVTQAVITRVTEGIGETGEEGPDSLHTVPSMFEAARLVGKAVRSVREEDAPSLSQENVAFDASFLVAGQIAGRRLRLFQVYSAGNYIEATADTPYLQIGEHKYGKPILDRVAKYDTPVEDAVKLALISMDSTLRSNLSVGMPIDLMTYRKDALHVEMRRRISEDDPYFRMIRERWSEALRQAYRDLPGPNAPLDAPKPSGGGRLFGP
ncbi:MAG: proteasome-type protease [Hyphomonadaceae bacterium]|nr:proteasome-type protease [Hyphomonadaceae bacterium]